MNTSSPSRLCAGTALAAKKPPVTEAIDTQYGEIGELHTAIGQLEDRLRTCRALPDTKPPGTAEAPEPIRLDARIEHNTRALVAATQRLNDLMSELVV